MIAVSFGATVSTHQIKNLCEAGNDPTTKFTIQPLCSQSTHWLLERVTDIIHCT